MHAEKFASFVPSVSCESYEPMFRNETATSSAFRRDSFNTAASLIMHGHTISLPRGAQSGAVPEEVDLQVCERFRQNGGIWCCVP